jgi:beta-glucanase (GH16 family)
MTEERQNIIFRVAAIVVAGSLLACSAGLVAMIYRAGPMPIDDDAWKLTFSDEFDGKSVDPAKWNLRDPFETGRNNELQAYLPDAFEVTEGVLRIIATRRPADYAGKPRDYVSGMMTTAGKFSQRFGRFEIRARVPSGRGLFPAFWLLPDDPPRWPPEIDVFEVLGHDTRTVHFTHHWFSDPANRIRTSDGSNVFGADRARKFSVYRVDWSPGMIVWSVDGVEMFRSTRSVPSDEKMFLLINLAVGGNWPGAPDAQTPFPAALEVDWVRVYRKQVAATIDKPTGP